MAPTPTRAPKPTVHFAAAPSIIASDATIVAWADTSTEEYSAAPGDTNMPDTASPTRASAPILRLAAAPQAAAPPAPSVATPAAADTSVNIKDFAFAPTATTVTVGTTVHWKNLDGEPHTVRSTDATFASNALDQNDSYSVKFDKPGTYKYVCSIHPQMVGTIVVKAAN
jgi:plastocyanin